MNLVIIINATSLEAEIRATLDDVCFSSFLQVSNHVHVNITKKGSKTVTPFLIKDFHSDFEDIVMTFRLPSCDFLEFFDACVSVMGNKYNPRHTMKLRNHIDMKLNPKPPRGHFSDLIF